MELGDLGQALPRIYGETIAPALEKLTAWLADFAGSFSPQLRQGFLSFTRVPGRRCRPWWRRGSGWVASAAAKVPGFLVAAGFTLVSSVFFALDYQRVTRFLKGQLPPNTSAW